MFGALSARRSRHSAHRGTAAPSASDSLPKEDALSESMRKFLLMDLEPGDAPKPISHLKCFFFRLLLTDPENVQQQLVMVSELLSVIGGLMLAITTIHNPSRTESVTWDAEMSAGDWMDGLNLVNQFAMLVSCLMGFMCAVYTSVAGHKREMKFYEGVLEMVAFGFQLNNVGLFSIPIVLSFDLFRTTHPIPATVSVVIGWGMFAKLFSVALPAFFWPHMPLESFHAGFDIHVQQGVCIGGPRKRLEARAVATAAELRAQLASPTTTEAACQCDSEGTSATAEVQAI